jgi:dolichol kinase
MKDQDSLNSSFSENKRQWEHIAPVGFAFLLESLPYGVVVSLAVLSIFYGVYGSRVLLKETTMRLSERQRRFSWGKFFYGLMVLLLVLVFYNRLYLAGAVWAILASGDGFSNLLGRRWGLKKLPWNSQKSWVGSFAFLICGGLMALVLLLWLGPSLSWSLSLQLAFIPALLCALVESIPWRIDDNFSVVLTGAFFCHWIDQGYVLW